MSSNQLSAKKNVYDSLDRELIGLLRNDGRASIAQMATKLRVSRATVQNRLDRLVASGVLLGFTILVRDDYGQDMVRAVTLIEVVGKSTSRVIRALHGFPELVNLHTTNGVWDLVAETRTHSLAEFDRVLREIRHIDGILNSDTSILLSSV